MSIKMNLIDCVDNRKYDPKEIANLAENMKAVGLINPIRLEQQGDRYAVIAGRRRFRALSTFIGAELPDGYYTIGSGDKAELVAFSENFHRENLSLAEEVAQLAALKTEYATIEQLASMIGKPVNWTALRLRLGNLIKEWQAVLNHPEDYPGWTAAHLELVARLPEDVQKKYINSYRGPKKGESAAALKQFREYLAKGILTIGDKPWQADCPKCRKRSSCDGMLFEDFKADGPDHCLDKNCYDKKEDAYLKKEVAKIKKEKLPIQLVIETGPEWGSWLGQEKYLYPHEYEIVKADKDAAPNAFVLTGPKAGLYVNIKIKTKAKAVGAAPAGASKKPEKTLADRENELLAKRNKVAIKKLVDLMDKGFPPPSQRDILDLAVIYGVRGNWELGYNGLRSALKKRREDKSADAEVIRSFWEDIQNSIRSQINQQLDRTLDRIDADGAQAFCELTGTSWSQIFAQAEAEIPAPKALLLARLEAESSKKKTAEKKNPKTEPVKK